MKLTTPDSLCIVMPAYNEQECIEIVVNSWLAFLETDFPSESGVLIVVNDGSKDRTGDILNTLTATHKSLIVIHQKNGGHGSALLAAYRAALDLSPAWVFHVDSDDQFLPQDFGKLWQHRQESNFITGYRKVRNDAFHRLIITRVVRALNFLLFGCYLKDANIPYRLIRGPYLQVLLQLLPDGVFAPNIFLAVLAARDGQKLFEIPISHRKRDTGKVSIVHWKLIKVCYRSAKELLKFRLSLPQKLRLIRAAGLQE
jgi:dolichol-phosphate mannosyltransferase